MSVPKRKQLSKAIRLEVLNKYDNHCAYCGCELTYEQLNVDHKIPLYYAEFGYDINYLESMDIICLPAAVATNIRQHIPSKPLGK